MKLCKVILDIKFQGSQPAISTFVCVQTPHYYILLELQYSWKLHSRQLFKLILMSMNRSNGVHSEITAYFISKTRT